MTGTFTASGEQLTFTANFATSKNFVLSLNNGAASVGASFAIDPIITSSFSFDFGTPPVGDFLATINAPQEAINYASLYNLTIYAYLISGNVDNRFTSVQVPSSTSDAIGAITVPPGGFYMGQGSFVDVLVAELGGGGTPCYFNGTIRWQFELN